MVIEGGGSGAGDKQSSSDEKRSSTQPQQQQQQQQQHQPSQSQLPQQQTNITEAATTQSTVELGDQPPIPSSASTLQQQHHTSNPTGHQVIAVSASKGPAAFFNLARKFLATDEFCDLSALEGAIVSAVDAAHLLERSKLADIVRIQTSYVPVEPKRKSQQQSASSKESGISTAAVGTTAAPLELQREGQASTSRKTHLGKKGAPLRRSRIIITVKRTNDYKQWLEENPHHASGHNDDIEHSPT